MEYRWQQLEESLHLNREFRGWGLSFTTIKPIST
jgi:hypothetical protein